MRITDRNVLRVVRAPFSARHWRALYGLMSTLDHPATALVRYLTNRGDYPWRPTVRTPLGDVEVTLADRHDMLTLNEVFCRRDYGSQPWQTVVDVGANIGLATLFFLTRSSTTRVWAFEPDPANVSRLRENLAGFEDRYRLIEAVVMPDDVPEVRFVTGGRYGRVARTDEHAIILPAVWIARALREIAQEVGPIDLLKIDTEGTEAELVAKIPADVDVREIRFEDNGGHVKIIGRKTEQSGVWDVSQIAE